MLHILPRTLMICRLWESVGLKTNLLRRQDRLSPTDSWDLRYRPTLAQCCSYQASRWLHPQIALQRCGKQAALRTARLRQVCGSRCCATHFSLLVRRKAGKKHAARAPRRLRRSTTSAGGI